MGAGWKRIGMHVLGTVVSHAIDGVAVERRILVVDVTIGEGDDVVLAG